MLRVVVRLRLVLRFMICSVCLMIKCVMFLGVVFIVKWILSLFCCCVMLCEMML